MVEYTLDLDAVFGSLANATRRDILRRLAECEMPVGDIAKAYNLTLAAISKHLGVLERAKLVVKHKRGTEHVVQLSPAVLSDANHFIDQYLRIWNGRLDALDELLREEQAKQPN